MIAHLRQFFRHAGGRATGIVFALCGLIFGTWAALIPYVKHKFLLDEAQLGLLFLCMPVGTFIANPLSVLVISRWGVVRTSLVSLVMMAITFALPIVLPHIVWVAFGLVLAGAAFAFTNVAMNTCASSLEQFGGLRLMSACHGMWSLGAMSGALLSGFGIVVLKRIAPIGVNVYLLYMGLLFLTITWIAWKLQKDLAGIQGIIVETKGRLAIGITMFKHNKALWILISIILCTYLIEGTIADWSAVYMKEVIYAPESMAGWGFAVYSSCMAGGRFLGDDLISRHGHLVILRAGGLLAVLGLIVIMIADTPFMVLPGFMLTGLGISVASPILYASASRMPGMPSGAGLATMNNFGMAAFLGGPVLIGFIAKAFNLRFAFLLVAFAAAAWVIQTLIPSRRKMIP